MRAATKLYWGLGILVSTGITWEARVKANNGPLANLGAEKVVYNGLMAVGIILLCMGLREFLEQKSYSKTNGRQASTQSDHIHDSHQQAPRSTEENRSASYSRACKEIEVGDGATLEEIKAHWRRTCKQWHPDYGGSHDIWIRKKRAFDMLVAWREYTSDCD